jgi:hypothetical protein
MGSVVKRLLARVLLSMTASLIHFVHNAEFLVEYPNLPETWTRADVYWAWLGMTALGAGGLWLVQRGRRRVGLLLIAVYSLLGIDSLGHYVLAPMSAHTAAMNVTILLEVGAAALVLIEVLRQAVDLLRHTARGEARSDANRS